jgi:AraC family transcriptional regulator
LRDLRVLSAALEIVELRLGETMNAADLAKACYVSYSGLQKLFGYVFSCSVSEYISKRRLSRASTELLKSDRSITDIALEYQYVSPEVFTRAFRRFWGITPSEFRKTRRFSNLHPRLKVEIDCGGFNMPTRKPMDISELYDELKKLGGTYALSVDIVSFAQINDDYGYAAGDLVIAESFARIEHELSDNMLLFRTGGDEFAVVTALAHVGEAEKLAQKIIEHNGQVVKAGECDIPLSLRIGISKIPEKDFSYQKVLSILAKAEDRVRQTSDYVAVYIEDYN